MKILQTSGSLNECVGQYINTALKRREIERGSQRKWGGNRAAGCCMEDKGGSGSARIWKFNYNCALAVIPLVNGKAEREKRWIEMDEG